MTDTPYLSPAFAAGAGGIYLSGEDNFRLTTWGAVAALAVQLEGRFVGADGCTVPLVETQIPNSDRSAKTTIFPAREGLLTNVQLRVASGTAIGGSVAGLLEIIRGREGGVQPLGTLLQGYVTSATRLAWPGSPIVPLTGGAGRLRVIVGTDPAAGVEISETVPTGARWKLRSIAFTLVASAVVANRTPVLTIDDGANVLWEVSNNVAQTASQTVKYRAGVGVPLTTFGALAYLLPLPSELPLGAGSRIRTVTGAIDAGDNYGPPIYTVEEWLEQ
jgi:hypothetical protein